MVRAVDDVRPTAARVRAARDAAVGARFIADDDGDDEMTVKAGSSVNSTVLAMRVEGGRTRRSSTARARQPVRQTSGDALTTIGSGAVAGAWIARGARRRQAQVPVVAPPSPRPSQSTVQQSR